MGKAKKKKIKNFKLEQDELKPMTIGMFESRKKSSIGTFIILTIFILVIFFLPQITEIVNSYLYPEVETPVIPSTPVTPVEPGEDDTPSYDDTFYEYTETLKIVNDDITIDSFIVDSLNNTLTFTVTNNGKAQDIEDLNYYIEIYNSERTLIERVKLAHETVLANGAFRVLTKNISNESATTIGFVVLVKKTIQEYPEVSSISSDGAASLVCSNSFEKVTYKFEDGKLQELISEVSHKIDELDYTSIIEAQKLLVNNYNTKTGIVSTMFLYDGGYNITTNVNLNTASRLYIFSADSFKLDTEPKVVKFEMEAQGFMCE